MKFFKNNDIIVYIALAVFLILAILKIVFGWCNLYICGGALGALIFWQVFSDLRGK
jgi:uncharacterized membrane protein SpoIIM required for sporulation